MCRKGDFTAEKAHFQRTQHILEFRFWAQNGGGGGTENFVPFHLPPDILVYKLMEGTRTHLTEEREVLAESCGPDNGVHLGDVLLAREPHPAGRNLQKQEEKKPERYTSVRIFWALMVKFVLFRS
jgi:hypothetical protein